MIVEFGMKQNKGMRPQDIVIILKIICMGEKNWTQKDIAGSLHISQSGVSEALGRLSMSGLLMRDKQEVNRKSLQEFLVSGLKYVFPVQPGGVMRGLPTAHSAPPLSELIRGGQEEFVWPYDYGNLRGQAVEPLYHTVPRAAAEDKCLHRFLSLADALRIGRAREQKLAADKLNEMLKL